MNPMLDALAVSVAAVALLATIFLSILAVVISVKFSGVEARVKAIEEELKNEEYELVALRVIASIILRFVNDSFSSSDIERRQIEDIISALNSTLPASERIDGAVFESSMQKIIANFPRIALYAKLLSPAEDEITETLNDVVAKFPDSETLHYLEALSRVVGGTDRQQLQACVRKLRRKLMPYEARLWTG